MTYIEVTFIEVTYIEVTYIYVTEISMTQLKAIKIKKRGLLANYQLKSLRTLTDTTVRS